MRIVAVGECTVRYRFERTGTTGGEGRLEVNGETVGGGAVAPILTVSFAPLGLSVGSGRTSPVGDYSGTFPFTGELHDVTYELDDDAGVFTARGID